LSPPGNPCPSTRTIGPPERGRPTASPLEEAVGHPACPLLPCSLPHYRIFGRLFRSELVFPEYEAVPAAEGSSGPALSLVRQLRAPRSPIPRPDPDRLLGSTTVGADVPVELFQGHEGFMLRFADTGTFAISSGRIDWWPLDSADDETARSDAKARAIPLALHAGGHFCLHAGAALTPSGAIALIGPKRAGKSTLTAALVAAGATLLTDDVLAFEVDRADIVLPGAGAFLRVRDDSAAALDRLQLHRSPGVAGKINLHPVPEAAASIEAIGGMEPSVSSHSPLAAIYMLRPVDASDQADVARRRLDEGAATMAILANAKNVDLLGGPERLKLLDQAARIARTVPCWELEVPRDLARLADSASRVLAWHSANRE